LLIPGVGGQGGSAKDIADQLRAADYELGLARINSSSGLTHPWAKQKQAAPDNWAAVCVHEIFILNSEINYKP